MATDDDLLGWLAGAFRARGHTDDAAAVARQRVPARAAAHDYRLAASPLREETDDGDATREAP